MLKVLNPVSYVWKRDSYLNSYAWKHLRRLGMVKNIEAAYTVRVPFQKLHFRAMSADCVSGPQYAKHNVTCNKNSYWPVTHWLYSSFKAVISLSRENMLCAMCNYRKQRLYGRFTFLSWYSLIMLLWWRNCITDCATLQSLSSIAPQSMEQVYFLQRYLCFKE